LHGVQALYRPAKSLRSMPALHPLVKTPNQPQNEKGENDHQKTLQITTPSKLIRSEDLFLVPYYSTMCADARIIETPGTDLSGAGLNQFPCSRKATEMIAQKIMANRAFREIIINSRPRSCYWFLCEEAKRSPAIGTDG
jgi:hypothetical protein